MVELIHALPISERRVFSRKEAASYVGVSAGHFDKQVLEGEMPTALRMRGVRRWDKLSLDRAIEKIGGINSDAQQSEVTPYDAWSTSRGQN